MKDSTTITFPVIDKKTAKGIVAQSLKDGHNIGQSRITNFLVMVLISPVEDKEIENLPLELHGSRFDNSTLFFVRGKFGSCLL